MFQILEKLLDGRRKRKKDKYPDFSFFFSLIIKSEIQNKIGSREYTDSKKTISIHTHDDDSDIEGVNSSFINNIECDQLSPEDKIVYQEKLDKITELLKEDETASLVFYFMIDGYSSLEISDLMEKPVSEIENAKKRIKRVVNKVIPRTHKKNYKKELQCRTTELKI